MGKAAWMALAGVLSVAVAATAQDAGRSTLSMKPLEDLTAGALEILNRRCTVCHTAERFGARHFTRDQWQQVIGEMVSRGARLPGDELEVLRHGWKEK